MKLFFFLHATTIHKVSVVDWETFKIYGNLGKILCSHLPSNVPSIIFRFSECLDLLLEKIKKISISVPDFAAWDLQYVFFLNPEFDKLIKLLRLMKTRKGLTFLCYKNELGHKQLLLIVFGMLSYRLPISFLSIHPFW
jgi:hypothetical protein